MSFSPDNEQRYDESDELVGLGAGGIFAAALFLPVFNTARQLSEHATSSAGVLGPPLAGALVLSTISALVGESVVHLRQEFFPSDFPQDIPQQT